MKNILRILSLLLVLALAGCSVKPYPPGEQGTRPHTPETVTRDAFDGPSAPQPLTEPQDVTYPQPSPPAVPPADDAFVRVRDYIPDVAAELMYATDKNFTGQIIYDFTEPWLRYGTVKKLLLVQQDLDELGLYLKIWDAFRPVSAQFVLWDVCPNPVYVANPNSGVSAHSRGNTVDITLVDSQGNELTMPTEFDSFSPLADRNYSDCPADAAANALLLEEIMGRHGFVPYFGEWWHFSDLDSYPAEEHFQPAKEAFYQPKTAETVNLYALPDTEAETVARIPQGEVFLLLAWDGDYAYVDYLALRGYVPRARIIPAADAP